MDVDASSSSQASQRQVRLHLTTRDGDIALPESTGPILVPTGKYLNIWFRNSEERFLTFYSVLLYRFAKICAINFGQQFTRQ